MESLVNCTNNRYSKQAWRSLSRSNRIIRSLRFQPEARVASYVYCSPNSRQIIRGIKVDLPT